MTIRILVLAEAAYACISTPAYQIDVRLAPGRNAAQSLHEYATELRDEAQRKLLRASRIEQAAIELAAQ